MEDSPASSLNIENAPEEFTITPQLKFLMSNIKNIVPIQLTSDSYHLWRTQLLKLFCANEFDGFLTGDISCPNKFLFSESQQQLPNPTYRIWCITDQNLVAAICASISASILPYVLSLQSCFEIWQTLEKRLQSSHCSRVIQLKHELHNLNMKNLTMTQYLLEVKNLVDNIIAAGSQVDAEDIILYVLNGLPVKYQSFKIAIRTSVKPITLDDFYALLCSKEINIANESHKQLASHSLDSTIALNTYRRSGRRCGSDFLQRCWTQSWVIKFYCSWQFQQGRPPKQCLCCLSDLLQTRSSSLSMLASRKLLLYPYWNPPQAFLASSSITNEGWYLHSRAIEHLTTNPQHLSSSLSYNGSDQVFLDQPDNSSRT